MPSPRKAKMIVVLVFIIYCFKFVTIFVRTIRFRILGAKLDKLKIGSKKKGNADFTIISPRWKAFSWKQEPIEGQRNTKEISPNFTAQKITVLSVSYQNPWLIHRHQRTNWASVRGLLWRRKAGFPILCWFFADWRPSELTGKCSTCYS